MIKQKDYQWEAAIKIAKEDGADYVAILLGRLRDAQKEIEALEAAQQAVSASSQSSLTTNVPCMARQTSNAKTVRRQPC